MLQFLVSGAAEERAGAWPRALGGSRGPHPDLVPVWGGLGVGPANPGAQLVAFPGGLWGFFVLPHSSFHQRFSDAVTFEVSEHRCFFQICCVMGHACFVCVPRVQAP